MPHRPPRARRRGHVAAPAARPRATRSSGRSRRRREARRRAVARVDVRRRAATAASGRENLCDDARFTGCDLDGGFAEYTVADARFCFPIPDGYPDLQAAPLLCAGLIGYRALRMAGDAERLGLYGFGASAHIVAQVARYAGPAGVRVHARRATTRGAGVRARARRGVGGRVRRARRPRSSTRRSSSRPPARSCRSRCARSRKGGTVVCGGIHMSDIPSFPYELLWGERAVRSVANLTRARRRGVPRAGAAGAGAHHGQRRTRSTRANEALEDLRAGRFHGAAVVVP